MVANGKTRVVCGMSGGVDSSATAALLLEQGYDVVGITLKLWPQDCVSRAEDKCCGPQAVSDARAVCNKLGVPYYLIDEAAEFQSKVIQYFADEYKAGRTPNPCVMCNQNLKFGRLIDRADQLGAQFIATGHFARIDRVSVDSGGSRREEAYNNFPEKSQSLLTATPTRYLLKRGRDLKKDQSYFLFSLRQDQLARAMFPLGEKTKSDTREVARHCNLKTADKEESMEICFVPDNNYGKFLQQANLAQKHRGEIADVHGHVLGHHDGIEFYTIGQRKGLGITTPKPVYVVELDAENNRVVVGDETALDRDEFIVDRCNWIPFDHPPEQIEVMAKIRYNHPGTAATVLPIDRNKAKVKLHTPQRAITPGQAAVFYQDDLVVGGGWICR
ncbi:MAG TPA: tRNA 2-thiouridine(34) synthase MnmA [Verrucomicrobiae bacterium]|jgi:tRNA-specific 2-thiouridylase|nr:tRNA 2-thiouridine(34) synthase MnmA [Verrucomicrobiae bacterium]